MKKLLFSVLTCLMVLCFAQAGSASILYTATANGGNNYTLNFEVVNDWGTDIDYFNIFFGQTTDGLNFTNTDEFSNFNPDNWGTENPAGWWSYSFEPTAINIPGQFNSEGDADGDGTAENTIAAGATKTGFTVNFNWTGTGSYDGLYYEVGTLDSWNYGFVADGYTELKQNPTPPAVPEPATLLLLGMGLLGTAVISRRKKDFKNS